MRRHRSTPTPYTRFSVQPSQQHPVGRRHRGIYPELQPGGQARCRWVVFGLEVGGRFDRQAVALLHRLARARARDLVPWARAAAVAALTRRWTALAALAALRAHTQSLLELPILALRRQPRRRAAAGRALGGAAVGVL